MLILRLLVFFLISINVFAQIEKPTTWVYKSDKKAYKIGEMAEIKFTATIKKDWKIYASSMDPNIGPLITEFFTKANSSAQLIGKIKEAKAPKKVFEEIWESDVLIYKETASFIQKVKITGKNPIINTEIKYQSCTDVDGRCINDDEKFEITLTTIDEESAENKPDTVRAPINVNNEVKDTVIALNSTSNIEPPLEKESDENSLWKFLLIAFGAGFASIFMPCIYPIMPMTVSFFTKQKDGKSKALFYGISIMIIFGLMGLVTMLLGAPFLNFLSTHWIPNLIFFVIFILFGISLLGAFEIVLPHETVNKIDRLGDKGGLIGIFFMALTLVVVSFSCTVPFVGTLLIAAAQGEVLRPVYGMLAFGLPFAIVFSGLAMFPQYLKKMPKSGGWLNELKAVFGFLEFALALKFLSNIDLAYHWNLIHRNIFLVIWIIIAVLIFVYIMGFLRMPKDDKVEKWSGTRLFFAGIFLALALYMIPGVTNKSLSLLSGILPPLPIESSQNGEKLEANMRNLPHGLRGFKEFEYALEHAKKVNKPVLIDFTGHACANCRKMEENVWSKPEVLSRLKNDFVIASLYVDDKEVLPTEKQYVSKYDNELKKTVGDKNMDLEISKYNNNAQPFYIIIGLDGQKLIEPKAYSSSEEFIAFLDAGKAKFKQ